MWPSTALRAGAARSARARWRARRRSRDRRAAAVLSRQHPPQLLARLAHLHAHGRRRVAEDLRDLVGRQLLDIAQDDGQRLLRRQVVDGAREIDAPRAVRPPRLLAAPEEERAPAPALVQIAADVDGDAVEPADEVVSLVIAPEVAEDAQKRF